MRIISVDPGETIGMAYLDTYYGMHRVLQTDNVHEAIDKFTYWNELYLPDARLVEGYNSAGYLDKAKRTTIEVLGVFLHWGLCEVVAPQARLSSVDEATAMIEDEVQDMHRKGRDAISALAHAISYARENDAWV